MSKLKPQAPLKEKWQGKTEQQIKDSNSFTAFAIICLLATIVVAIIHEVYLWLQN